MEIKMRGVTDTFIIVMQMLIIAITSSAHETTCFTAQVIVVCQYIIIAPSLSFRKTDWDFLLPAYFRN